MTRYPPVNQHWDRWHQPVPHPAAPDYSSMMQVDSMVSYDPRPVPPAAALQRPTMATPYSVATSYAESPVTPMASSPYPSQGHFADYPPCSYQSPAVPSSAFAQMPYRSSYRPLAPPTPPLDEDRALRPDAGRLSYATGDAHDKSTRRSAAVKPEANEEHRAIKTIPKFVKLNGELQYESTRKFDLVLRLADKKINTEPEGDADTPQSMASPVPSPPEEEHKPKPVKKHICPVELCDRTFGQKAQLATHMRSHTGEKPYECDICDFTASQPGNLKTHKKSHSHEKPFSCPICRQTFKAKGSVKPHMQTKHEGRPKPKCPLHLMGKCRKTFTTIGNMKNHIENHHQAEVQLYTKMLLEYDEHTSEIDPQTLELFKTILKIYKNSNRGIKGRGVSKKTDRKEKKARAVDMKRERPQEMTPVSPDPSHAVQDYNRYYDQSQQPQYHVLPHPGQSHAGYMQLPLHTPPPPPPQQQQQQQQQQQHHQGLSHPSAYSMGWGPGPQYH